MTKDRSSSPKDDYFNDLSRQPHDNADRLYMDSGNGHDDHYAAGGINNDQPKAKRIACILCRKRKLRCDGARPTCGTCKRLSHDCAYDEVRKKSGPKRGYVKLLEARLQQVETLLKTQDGNEPPHAASNDTPSTLNASSNGRTTSSATTNSEGMAYGSADMLSLPRQPRKSTTGDDFSNFMDTTPQEPSPLSWELIGLGLEEPLPSQDVIDELHRLYFEKIHPCIPMIHRPRYLTAMNFTPNLQPPLCLRYMIWCLGSSASEKYESLTEIFYYRARKYGHMDEMKSHGEAVINLATCQAWLLIALYEFKNMYFPRAWLSVGRATRAAQMMMLHRLDGTGLDVKQCLPPPKNWLEREERRRTFWTAFCEDRYASIGTGWPMTIDERDIMTNLPASEQAYNQGTPEPTLSLERAMEPGGAPRLSTYAGVIVMAALFGRNLHHLHRPSSDDDESNLEGPFWRRHRTLESILSQVALSLPDHLRLPSGIPDPNVIFMNMAIHTSAICLHQAAIFKADRHRLPPNVSSESRVRCVTAAAETARIMRMISHLDLITMNPFMAFCLYVSARVFVQYLKFRPKDQQMIASLQFLLQAMHALKRKNALTESFLVQLDVDLEGAGIDVGQNALSLNRNFLAEIPQVSDSVKCSPLFELRESQSPAAEINRFQTAKERLTQVRARASQPGSISESPGPPFHVANATINLDTDASSYRYLSDRQNSFSLPHHAKSPGNTAGSGRVTSVHDSLSSPSDFGPSPIGNPDNASGPQSRSSPINPFSPQTQLTPPSQEGDPSCNLGGTYAASGISKNSPVSVDQSNNISTPDFNGAMPAGSVFNTGLAMDPTFSQFQAGNFMSFEDPNTNYFSGHVSGSVWEMSGIEITAPTGLTPAPSGDMNWTQVLESMGDWNASSEGLTPGFSGGFIINESQRRGTN